MKILTVLCLCIFFSCNEKKKETKSLENLETTIIDSVKEDKPTTVVIPEEQKLKSLNGVADSEPVV